MNRNLTAEQRLIRARTQILLNHVFFGTLAVRLKLLSGELPTMATDGRCVVYNRSLFSGSSQNSKVC